MTVVVQRDTRHGRGSILCNPTQHKTVQTKLNPTHDLCSHPWPNPTQPNTEQQHNVVQIGYINQKPISK